MRNLLKIFIKVVNLLERENFMKKNKKEFNKKQILVWISQVVNILIVGFYAGMGGKWLAIILLMPIAYFWGYTAKYGEAIFKLVTPQVDYIHRSKLSLVLSEWILSLIISIGLFYGIATVILVVIFGLRIQ